MFLKPVIRMICVSMFYLELSMNSAQKTRVGALDQDDGLDSVAAGRINCYDKEARPLRPNVEDCRRVVSQIPRDQNIHLFSSDKSPPVVWKEESGTCSMKATLVNMTLIVRVSFYSMWLAADNIVRRCQTSDTTGG